MIYTIAVYTLVSLVVVGVLLTAFAAVSLAYTIWIGLGRMQKAIASRVLNPSAVRTLLTAVRLH